MSLPATADHAVLRRAVGPDTLARGLRYAEDGAVLGAHWDEDGERIVGQVRGNAARPYTAIAIVESTSGGALRSFRGACTCPVGMNCKHAVALALVRPARVALPEWEQRLQALGMSEPQEQYRAVALQFELTTARAHAPAPTLTVRPVLAGPDGGWVRTGISWSGLRRHRYDDYGRPPVEPRHWAVLTEFQVLEAAFATGYPSTYPSTGGALDLGAFASPRLWDLLRAAAHAGIAFVTPGSRGPAVLVRDAPVDLVVDLDRADGSVLLRALLAYGDETWPAEGSVLLGEHGVAWRSADGLNLAPLAAAPQPVLRELLAGDLAVPAADEQRFFDGFYPRLRRRVRVTSNAGSVALPAPATPTLVLAVTHERADLARLHWRWRYGSRTEPLWIGPGGDSDERDLIAEEPVRERAADAFGALPEATDDAGHLRESVQLTGMEVVHLVRTVLPELRQLDHVVVELSGEVPDYRAVDGVTEIEFADASAEGDWFDLAVTVRVGGQQLPFESLFVALATGRRTLILPDGRYLNLDRPELQRLAEIIADARSMQDAPPATVRVNRYHAATWRDLDDVGTISGPAARWQQTVRALVDVEHLAPVPVPATMQATLRPYQHDGLRWLAFLHEHGLGGVLADDMGLGKTVQTLALICRAQEIQPAGPFLIVAPTSVLSNWVSEAARFAPSLRVRAVTGTAARRVGTLADAVRDADVVVTSYTLFRLEFDDYAALDWAGLVLDEAQAAKNHLSRNYACARNLPAPFKLAITGTPMENHLGELWSLLSITAPGLFPELRRFDEHFRRPIERGRDRARLAELRERVRPLMLRRSKDEVAADLPEKQENVLEVELHPKHRRAYQTVLHRERQKVLGLLDDLDGNRFEILRSLTVLRQASLSMGLVDPTAESVPASKLDVLVDLLTGIAADGHRTLVFSQFTRFLRAARDRLDAAGLAYCYLDGTTRDRARVIEAFKTGDAPVFLISLKAGGMGLNLTEADYCVLLDPWWNPATEAQAVDRAHRIGQQNKVIVYRMVAKDTIEEKVSALKERKAALFANVLGTGEFAAARLDASDIRAMLG